jgi:ubiquinone/menaquinone biosynthesis C-methylase UbiE
MMTPVARLMEISYDGLVAQRALYAAAKLGVADALAGAETSSDQVAQEVGAEPESTYRLMRTLASIGILAESAGRQFGLTPTGELLRTDHPQSMRQWIIFSGEPAYLAAWGEIVHTIQTGRPAWDKAHTLSFFEYMAAHPEAGRIFDEAMTSLSHEEAQAVAGAYDFTQFHNVVDVGGGQGNLLVTLLKRYPAMRGVVFDQPQVVEQAKTVLTAEGLGSRCGLESGDFFNAVPAGGDAYLLKYILHDWDDAHAVTILASCRRAIRPDGKLLLVETVVPGPDEAHFAKLQDLEMLVLFASRERTEEEYGRLLKQAGFRLERVVPTVQPVSVVEAVPI